MPSPVVKVVPNPKVGVPHGLSITRDGDTVTSYQWTSTSAIATPPSNISGATSATFTPTEALAGRFLGCLVNFSSAGEIEAIPYTESKILKHTAATTGPRFRITRSSNAPSAKTSFEAARESRQS